MPRTRLDFLKTQWVAPLGSLALIFNFIFAKILVGTKITRQDILGTFIVMASVVWIVTFGGMNSAGADVEDSLTILELKALFSRIVFIIYFSILNLVIIAVLSLGTYAYWTITLDESHLDPTTERLMRKRMKMRLTALLGKNRLARASGLTLQEDEEQDGVVIEEREMAARDLRMRKVVAMIMATCGGLLASQTLLLAKSGIKLITSSIPGASSRSPGGLSGDQSQRQFQDPLSFFILFLLVLTAVFQVLCLNTALKLYDSVLVVPLFYGFYTTFGLVNSIIYLNQFSDYQPWVLLLIILGIALLILGVRMLSSPKPENEDHVARSTYDAGQPPDCHDGLEGSLKDDHLFHLSDKEIQTQPQFSEEGGRGIEGTLAQTPLTVTETHRSLAYSRFRFLGNLTDRIRRKRGSSSTMTTAVAVGPSLGLVFVNNLHDTMSEDGGLKPSSIVQSQQHTRPSGLQVPHQFADPRHVDAYDGRGRDAVNECKRPAPPRIDTLAGSTNPYPTESYTRGRSETRRVPSSPSVRHSSSPVPRPMSPSEFRAQYTNSPFPIKPKHLQDGTPGLNGSRSSSPKAWNEGAACQGSLSMQRSHSPKWLTGSAKIDQVFEDLNPFKKFRRNSADGSVVLRGHGNESIVGELHSRSRRTSLSTLPSEWDEAATNRKLKHSTLFGEHGSRQSSRSSSPAPSQRSTPARSRRQSTTAEPMVGSEASTGRTIGPLDLALKDMSRDYYGPTWQQQHQQRQLRQSSNLQQQSPVTATRTHGRQLSFTTKNDGKGGSGSSGSGMAAALASVGLSVTGPPSFTSGAFSSASGTFGPPSKNRTFNSSTSETSHSSGSVEDNQSNFLPLSVQLQLQQLSQLQHYPTSQLQHSMTTSSISTIGSTRLPASNNYNNNNNNNCLSSDSLSISSAFSTETSLAQYLAQEMTPPQPLHGMAGYIDSEDEHGSLD